MQKDILVKKACINLKIGNVYTIYLNNLHFHAHHGLFEEEKIIGNEFIVSVEIVLLNEQIISDLKQSIDYSDVYEIIKGLMNIPTPLLETIATNISDAIYGYNKNIKEISVKIEKKHPPIQHFMGNVAVSYKKAFQ
jgi:dihydroneopterin aldolase